MIPTDLDPERLKYLLQRYASDRCTRQELLELLRAMEKGVEDEALQQFMQDIWRSLTDEEVLPVLDKEKIFKNVLRHARELPKGSRNTNMARLAAAAVIILALGGGITWYFSGHGAGWLRGTETIAKGQPMLPQEDAAPGGNKAVLTLADGTAIVLDSARNGALSRQGNTMVLKLSNGQLAYKGTEDRIKPGLGLAYNKVTTPRGGKYEINLPDGSIVWLNAASSLRFPTDFPGKERHVELSGEAYFEIAKDKDKPFYVEARGVKVQVLGTAFNVMAYADENTVRTTLMEGAVQVTGASGSKVRLTPGEQAQCGKDGGLKLVDGDNLDEAVAWKNDLFYFRGADVQSIMRQLARWYDIEPVYSGVVNGRFYARIPRNTKLSTVLRALALTNKLNLVIEGKKVIVQP